MSRKWTYMVVPTNRKYLSTGMVCVKAETKTKQGKFSLYEYGITEEIAMANAKEATKKRHLP